MNRSYKELLSNTAVFAVSSLLSKVLLMLLLPVYTNELTPEQYGIVELATNISLLLIPFASLAIQDAIFRFTIDGSIERKEVFKNSFWVLVLATFILLICAVGIKFYEPLHEWSIWFWGFATLSMYRSAISLYAKGTDKTKVFAIDGVLYNVVLALSNIAFLVLFKLKIEGYFLALILAQMISITYLMINVEKPPLRYVLKLPINKDTLTQMLLYSTPLVLNSISWNLAHTVDRVMLEAMRSKADVGIYSVALKIPSLISTIMSIFIQAWSISAIRNFEHSEGSEFYSRVFQYAEMLLVFVTLSVLFINNHIVVLLFGPEFRQAIFYTPILMISASVLFYSNYFGPIFSSAKKSRVLMETTMAGTVVNVVLNYCLISRFGILGATIATFFSNMVISILRVMLTRRIYAFSIEWSSLLFGWLLIIVGCIGTMAGGKWAECIDGMLVVAAFVLYRKQFRDFIRFVFSRFGRG